MQEAHSLNLPLRSILSLQRHQNACLTIANRAKSEP